MKDDRDTKNVVRRQLDEAKANGGNEPRTVRQSFRDLNQRRAAEGKPPILPAGRTDRAEVKADRTLDEFKSRWQP